MTNAMLKIFSMIFGFYLCLTIVGANSIDYYIIVEDNGNSVVVMTISGEGLINIPIDEKTEDINVKGALYMVNDDSIDVSIGSTQEAVVIYSTPSLTGKSDDWFFGLDLVDSETTTATVAISSNATVTGTTPNAFIDDHDFKEIKWAGNVSEISIEYYFESVTVIDPPEKKSVSRELVLIPSLVAVAGGSFVYFKKKKEMTRRRNRENILKTLSNNEKKIMDIMIANKGQMKRNRLEKKSGISKSSLAGALNNLEKKNLVDIDKMYKTHFVKLTKWFDEL